MKAYRTKLAGRTWAAGLLSLLAFASLAHAHGGPHGGFAGPGWGMPGAEMMLERIADHLELDETQRQNVSNIIEAAKPGFQALRQSARENHETLAALDPADANYSTELDAAAAENGRLATEATLLAARVRNELREVLTAEQLAELEAAKDRMRDHKRHHSGRR